MYRFFFHAPSPSEIYTLSLHDALPISQYFVDIVINRFGKAFIDEQLMTAGNYYGDDDDDDWGNDDNNNNNNNNSGYGNYGRDRKSTRLNSSHVSISYAVFCLKKKK